MCAHDIMYRIYVCMYLLIDMFYFASIATVWPEILVRRYFGTLLKICHLAEFTLVVEPVLAIMIFTTKWLIKHAGYLTR